MTGYELTRNWYNYKFENVGKVKSIHSDLYFYIIDLWNRLGQKENFGLPTSVTMELMGIGSYNTYKKALQDLIDFGFIKVIQESANQYQSKIIALSNFDKALDKALDKAHIKATDKALDEPTDKATDTIVEQKNNVTTKQKNNETIKVKGINFEYDQELETLLFVFNKVFKTNYKSIDTLKNNYAHWRKTYEPVEIEQAIVNASKDDFWKTVLKPETLFRQKNPNKENVDYIGQFLNLKPKQDAKTKFQSGFQDFVNEKLNNLKNKGYGQ